MPSLSKVALGSLAAALALTFPAAASDQKVKVPKDGTWTGSRKTVMSVSGKSIDLLAFNFPCRKTKGRTSLNAIALKRTDEGYKFRIRAHGNVSYQNEHRDQNGAVSMSGQFNRKGTKVTGHFQVSTRYCGSTAKLDWSAKYAPGS
jgi:hypothetical protein